MIASKLLHRGGGILSTILSSSKYQRIFLTRSFNRSKNYYMGALILNHIKMPEQLSRDHLLFPLNYPQFSDQKRLYANLDRKNLNIKFEKGKQILTDNIELKRQRMRERKEILVQGIREKKSKVQEKVREMEEIVERENIFTIPNFLCVARSFLAPYIGYVIIQENYQLAIGLLVFAGLTDLVDYISLPTFNLFINIFYITNYDVYNTTYMHHSWMDSLPAIGHHKPANWAHF